MTNPLDDLTQHPSLSVAPTARAHTSGRRELRQERLANGITLRVRAASPEDKVRAARGEFIASLPIRRATAKLTKAEKKRAKRARRDARKEQS